MNVDDFEIRESRIWILDFRVWVNPDTPDQRRVGWFLGLLPSKAPHRAMVVLSCLMPSWIFSPPKKRLLRKRLR